MESKSSSGWIKLHRSILEWEWFNEPRVLQVWMYLLLRANSKERKVRGIEVKRGQLTTSYSAMADFLGCERRTIAPAIEKLVESGCISTEFGKGKRYVTITILKYDNYQIDLGKKVPSNMPSQVPSNMPSQVPSNTPLTRIEEVKEEKNIDDVDDNAGEGKENLLDRPGSEVLMLDIEVLYAEHRKNLLEETEVSNAMIRYFKNGYEYDISRDELARWLDMYQDTQRMISKGYDTLSDYRSHFRNWLRIQIENKIKNIKSYGKPTTNRGATRSILEVSKTSDGTEFDF